MASTLRMRTAISPPAVAAMDSCFALIVAHQHDIAVGSMSWYVCFSAKFGWWRNKLVWVEKSLKTRGCIMTCYRCRCFRFRLRLGFRFLSSFFLDYPAITLPSPLTPPSPALFLFAMLLWWLLPFFSFFGRSLSRKIQQGKKTAVLDLFRIVMERIVESWYLG